MLRIFTDAGIEGNCLVGAFRGGGHPHFDPILKTLKPELIGRDLAEREWLWNRLRILSSRRGITNSDWAPVDVALWDISGKAAGLPIYKLIGTQRYETQANQPVSRYHPPWSMFLNAVTPPSSQLTRRGYRLILLQRQHQPR